MENIFENLNKSVRNCWEEQQEYFIEFMMSDVHKCDAATNDGIIFYVTPDGDLKYTPNSQSIYGFSGGTKVKCCMWCGFEPNDEKKSG